MGRRHQTLRRKIYESRFQAPRRLLPLQIRLRLELEHRGYRSPPGLLHGTQNRIGRDRRAVRRIPFGVRMVPPAVPEGSGRIEISFLAPEKEKGTAALFEAYLYGSESPYCMFVGNGEFQQNKWEVNTDKCYLKIQNVQTTGQSDSDSPFNSLVPYQFELNFVSDELE